MIKRISLLFIVHAFAFSAYAQPNCEAYKYLGNTLKYNACKKTEEADGHYQFSREFQEIMDEAIRIDSSYAPAYRAKSVAYLKSGDFLAWKKLMDKAVAFDPKDNLGYRGWCRYQFFRDYQGAIDDIERLQGMVSYDIGHGANGDYHLNIARALCYRALGKPEKAIAIMEAQLKDKSTFAGNYAQLHLGVLYLKAGRLQEAIQAFSEQTVLNEMAENQYYLSLAYKALGDHEKYRQSLEQAKDLYQKGYKLFDPYTDPYDKVYLAEIEAELSMAAKRQ